MFGINYKNVVVSGDSAGGNLAIAVTVMAIKRGFRKPDALKPCYPSTIISPDAFWPSILCALDDPILSQGLLAIIQGSVTPTGAHKFIGTKNLYMSPGLHAPDEILKQFPPTIITLAGIDPLKDDGLFFLNRLIQLDVKARGVEFHLMPHGYLNFDFPFNKGMRESKIAINKTGEFLKELIEQLNSVEHTY